MFRTISKSIVSAAIIASSACLSHTVYATSIDDALAAQEEKAQTRYQFRHPKETLEFFGIKDGMTVVEALPGGGWYSKILLPVLGEKGKLIGADYAQDMWSNFSFMTPERIEEKKVWVDTWTKQAEEWRSEGDASIAAFQFNNVPKSMHGSADAVLFIRALHNLSRFQDKGDFLTTALTNAHTVLKEGGVVGVVQHAALEDRTDEWANGNNGYLKKSAVIAHFEANGFEFIKESDINTNDLDKAKEGDFVWRLPPSLSGSKDDEEKRAAMKAIGESNRMTLLFKKS